MRYRFTSLCLFILTLVATTTARADVTATIVPGDQITGDLSEGETDRFNVLVASPSSLSVSISTKSGLEVALSVLGPDGDDLDLAGSLVKSPGRTPRVSAAQLRTAGTYTVVASHANGKGEYSLAVKLGKPKGQRVDLRDPPSSSHDAIVIAADDVTFDRGGTSLSATTTQGAVEELSNRADATEAAVADHALRLPPLEQAASSLADRLTTVETLTTEIDGRVLTLEGAAQSASRALRVYSSLDTTQTVAAQFFKYLPATQNDDAFRVRRHKAATVSFAPGEIEETVVVFLTWTYRPDFAVGVQPKPSNPLGQTVWAEIGSKEVFFNAREVAPEPKEHADVLGVDVPTDVIPNTFSWRLVYEPTPSERADGFTLDVLLSAWDFGYDKTGFSADISAAVVLGR